jgi:ech hydrogenase subunit A
MVLLCLLFPFLSRSFVDPTVVQLFGNYQDVIPVEILYILIICVGVTFAVPIVCFLANRKRPFEQKLAYMGGINEDYDNSYTDSYGEKEKLWLTNYYFAHKIGQRKLMIPSQLIALAALVIMISRVIGGAF